MSAYVNPHRYDERLKATLDRIARDPKIRAADKKLILDYIVYCQAQGLSTGRRFKLATLIIDALNREGVFKFRRMAYFCVGRKKRQEAEI